MKKIRERAPRGRSQAVRLAAQLALLLLNVWVGVGFIRWVGYIETPGSTAVARPSGVEGWLPIAGLMNLKYWLVTKTIPVVHPAAMFLLVAFLLIAVVLKKACCSWVCPIGTVSEGLWKLGRRIMKRSFVLPRWADLPLRAVKYLLFAFFGWTILRMPADAIAEFLASPYGAITDIRLLHFFRFIGVTGSVVLTVLVVLSLAIPNFWCRYLCPYGALLGIVSLASPTRITRDADECIDCAKCAKACPSSLPVDVLPAVRSVECTMCMSCVAVCPAKNALQVKSFGRALPSWAVAAIMATIFLGVVVAARATGHWNRQLPDDLVRYFLSLG
jgi:polyferredoxin